MSTIRLFYTIKRWYFLLFILIPIFQGNVFPKNLSTDWFSVAAIISHQKALSGAHDIELSGNLAFIPGKGGSLAIVDVSVPEKPELLWFRQNNKELEDAETVLPLGRFLLLGTSDFFSIDISNPRKPLFLNKISDRAEGRIGRINGMVKRGNYIFAANKSGWIDVFDVTDIPSPKLFGALNVREKFSLFDPHDIDMFEKYVVIVCPHQFGRNPTGKLALFRVFKENSQEILPPDQWKPEGLVEAKELRGANRIQVSGRFAFTGGSFSPQVKKEQPGIYANLGVVDLSEPENPNIVVSHPFGDTRRTRGPNGLTISGKVVFLAGGETVEAVDISDPVFPTTLGSQKLPASNIKVYPSRRTDNAHDLVYRDGYLFVTCQSDYSLAILKITDKGILDLAES